MRRGRFRIAERGNTRATEEQHGLLCENVTADGSMMYLIHHTRQRSSQIAFGVNLSRRARLSHQTSPFRHSDTNVQATICPPRPISVKDRGF
jgi:hypothetical protein